MSDLNIYLSKMLPLLVLPIGIVIVFSLVAVMLVILDKQRPAIFFLMSALLVLWTSSMPIVADTLMGRLEMDFPVVAMRDIPAPKCIVLLGGTVRPPPSPGASLDMLDAVDRVRKTAQLFHAGKGKVIIISGGNLPWSPSAESEAESMKILLKEWGVPDSAIVLEELSRNTYENAISSMVVLEELNCFTPLLVTSAAHMKRAVKTFEKLGISVFPVSADVRAVNKSDLTLIDFLPDAVALKMTTDAMREWIGQKVYRFKGWN